MKKNNTFHLVTPSPWPFVLKLTLFSISMGTIDFFHSYSTNLLLFSMFNLSLISSIWWRDVIRESTFMGLHTLKVSMNMRLGMILFIVSEIFLFISLFWSFFHSSLSPNIELGMMWSPKNVSMFNPMEIPLLNTLILISSGITVTWSHHSLINNNYHQTLTSLFLTILLGLYFTMIQSFEYFEASFSLSDSIIGSTFFMMTGFHGAHVMVGTIFLMICLIRQLKNHFSPLHHIGFESAIWYWHFVDIEAYDVAVM